MRVLPISFIAAAFVCIVMLAGCVKQQTSQIDEVGQDVRTAKTMITGIDQFEGGQVWGLNTSLGVFVVGPEVPGGVKSDLYERLVEAHEDVITILYEEIPASRGVVAHKRVIGMVVRGEEYRLDY